MVIKRFGILVNLGLSTRGIVCIQDSGILLLKNGGRGLPSSMLSKFTKIH